MIWAIGRMNHQKEPSVHDFFPRSVLKLDLDPKPPIDTCYSFTVNTETLKKYIFIHNVKCIFIYFLNNRYF